MEKTRKMRQFYIEFIELYRSKPELWKVKSEEYKNRVIKAKAYDMLADKFKEIGEDVDRDFVKKKINSLRSSYRRELRKCNASLQSGEEYIPSLWHFKYLYFLRDQEESLDEEEEYQHQHKTTREQRGNYRQSDTSNNSYDDRMLNQLKKKRKNENSLKTAMLSGDESTQQHDITSKKWRRDESLDQNELLQLAFQQLKQSNDEAEILGRVWACEFKKLSPDQQIFAKKAIDDILFEGRMDTLHRHSVKINEGSQEYCSNLADGSDTKVLEFEYGGEETE